MRVGMAFLRHCQVPLRRTRVPVDPLSRFDCLVGCAVAAPMVGTKAPGDTAAGRQRKRYTQDDFPSLSHSRQTHVRRPSRASAQLLHREGIAPRLSLGTVRYHADCCSGPSPNSPPWPCVARRPAPRHRCSRSTWPRPLQVDREKRLPTSRAVVESPGRPTVVVGRRLFRKPRSRRSHSGRRLRSVWGIPGGHDTGPRHRQERPGSTPCTESL